MGADTLFLFVFCIHCIFFSIYGDAFRVDGRIMKYSKHPRLCTQLFFYCFNATHEYIVHHYPNSALTSGASRTPD